MPGSDDSGHPPRLVVAVGEAAGVVVGDRDRLRVLPNADAAGAVLDEELPRLTTGWRVLAVGSGPEVRAVRAAALARGAVGEEVSVLVRGDEADVTVRCGVCHATTGARVGEALDCPACGTALAVTDHESAVHGAVLGAPRPR
jgi:hypothetical protein